MLFITQEIISLISSVFSICNEEKGFLLGCNNSMTHINSCLELPALESNLYYYKPNTIIADDLINYWSNNDICFCGLIHSHIVNKKDLSENDIEYAKALYSAYNLPVLWFGIGIVHSNQIEFNFYSVTENKGDIAIILEEYQIEK